MKLVRRNIDLSIGLAALAGIILFVGTGAIVQMSQAEHFHWETLWLLGALFAALALSLFRFHRNAALQEQLARVRDDEVALGRKALDAHNIVSVTDPSAKIIHVNDNFLEVFGYEHSEVIGKKHNFVHPWQGDDSKFDEIHACVKAGKTWSGVHVGYTRTGDKRYFKCTVVPLFDDSGRHVKNISVRTDVTQLRAAEASNHVKTMLDNLQDEVFVYRVSDLSIQYMNVAACRRCEWTQEESRSKRIVDTDPNFDERLFRAHVTPLFSGDTESVVIEARQAKGYVEINTRLCTDLTGEPVFVSVLRDIDARKQIEKAKMASVSVVSHELRTPLTSITGALRMLKAGSGGPFSPAAAAMIDIASRNTERLLFMVNDIMDLEKIQAGKMECKKEEVDLAELLKEAIQTNDTYGREFGVTFAYSGPDQGALVLGDKDRLFQVLTNLLSNASKYSPEQGTVRVALAEEGDQWRVSVRDNGPGIPAEDREKVFLSFSQLVPADGVKRPGTGLGLAITQKIVRLHSGTIDFESEVGSGTTFHVDLPKIASHPTDLDQDPDSLAAE